MKSEKTLMQMFLLRETRILNMLNFLILGHDSRCNIQKVSYLIRVKLLGKLLVFYTVNQVFRSLREFHMELIGSEAVLNEEHTVLRYRDLISTFEGLLIKMCTLQNVQFPTNLGVNAFRGFLNEFQQQQAKRRGSNKKSVSIIKKAKKQRRKSGINNPSRCFYVKIPIKSNSK
jgi:hypothetical protein